MFKRYQESMALVHTFWLENCGCSLQLASLFRMFVPFLASVLHQAEILQGLPELVGDLHKDSLNCQSDSGWTCLDHLQHVT